LLLQERLEHAGQRVQRSRAHTAVLFVDIDRFKQINDSYGHQMGDDLLVAVAERLTPLIRRGDTLARFSGDEFVFLCEDMQGSDDAQALARRIQGAFSLPFEVGGTSIAVTASVGTSSTGPDQGVSEELLAQADIAMYQVKQKGGAGHQVFDLRAAQLVTERLTRGRARQRGGGFAAMDVSGERAGLPGVDGGSR
jgi:diguanylate cyclase (GGDEF)-like protein